MTDEHAANPRLESWKEIATYLGRDVSTVQRWERSEGLPVHRHPHAERSSVYAFREELEAWRRGRAHTPVRRLADPAANPVVAVLPFDDLSPDKGLTHLCEGLAVETINHLCRVDGLTVLARHSSFRAAAHRTDVAKLRQLLRVDSLVEGSIVPLDHQYRVSVRIVSAEDGRISASQTFDVDRSDVRCLHDAIRRTVDALLRRRATASGQMEASDRLQPPRHEDSHSSDPEAYNLYLEGRHHRSRRVEGSLYKAIGLFKAAIERDPSYVLAYAGLAECYVSLAGFGLADAGLALVEARRLLEEASRIDPEASQTVAVRGSLACYGDWRFHEAEEHWALALEDTPGNSDVRAHYALAKAIVGDLSGADRHAEIAARADPLSPWPVFVKAAVAFFSGRFADVLTLADEGLRKELHLALGGARIFGLLGLGRFDEAVMSAEMAARLTSRQPPVLGLLGLSYGLAGSRDAAESILGELTGRSAAEHITPWAFAEVCAGLGDAPTAVQWLERAVEQRSLIAWLSASHSPWHRNVRSTSSFRSLAQRVFDAHEADSNRTGR